MLSCVTKEEFVDFTIQIIENSMGQYIQLDQYQKIKYKNKETKSMQLNLTQLMRKYKSCSPSAYMRQKTKELKTPVKVQFSSIIIGFDLICLSIDVC